MAVTVRIPTTLRPMAGGNSTVQVEGATLAEVIANLLERLGIAIEPEPPPDDFCFAIRKPGDQREDDRARARAARVVLGARTVDIDEYVRPGERCAVADRVVE